MSVLVNLDFVPPGRTLGKLGQRMCPAGVFIKARWAALARPEELLAVELVLPEAGRLGLGLAASGTLAQPQAGRDSPARR
jgi:hypothetical protein